MFFCLPNRNGKKASFQTQVAPLYIPSRDRELDAMKRSIETRADTNVVNEDGVIFLDIHPDILSALFCCIFNTRTTDFRKKNTTVL